MPAESLTPQQRALRCPEHLACVSGPDLGSVIPLENGAIVGRQTMGWLADPSLPRIGWRIAPQDGSGLALRSTKGSAVIRVKAGKTIQLGSGRWQVRKRPARARWPLPHTGIQGRRWISILPAILIAALLMRFLPGSWDLKLGVAGAGLGLVGIGLAVRKIRRRSTFDAAALALAAELGTPAAPLSASAKKPLRVYAGRWGGPKISISPGEHVGIVGRGASQSARWIGAQLLLATSGIPLVVRARETLGPAPPVDQTVIFWAEHLEEFQPGVSQVLQARAPVGVGWLLPGPFLGDSPAEEDTLPDSVSFHEIGMPLSPATIETQWSEFSFNWAIPVAVEAGGKVFSLDLLSDGPHALLAGATGSGKTVALQTWLWSLVAHVPPDFLRLVLIDYKGGAGLSSLASAPHVEVFTSDLEPGMTAWVLRKLTMVLQERKSQLRAAGFAEVRQWELGWSEGTAEEAPPPRVLVVVDEFQVLHEEHADLMGAFTRLAAQGRSLGLHLVFATQRPGQAVNADLRGTVDLRIGLRFTEPLDAQAATGTVDAAKLPAIPGRAVVSGKQIQFAHGRPPELPPVSTDRTRNWPEPLPHRLRARDIDPTNLGIREHADGQIRSVPLPEGALLFSGPDLEDLSAAAHWAAGQMAKAARKDVHSVPLAEGSLAEVSLLLSRGAWGKTGALYVPDLSSLQQEFEFHGLGPELAQFWMSLVVKAERGDLILVAADSEGSRLGRAIRQRLTRIPTAAHWHHPSVMRAAPELPRMGSALASVSVLSREEAVTDPPGRFLASGFPSQRPFLLQMPTDIPAIAPSAGDSLKAAVTTHGAGPWLRSGIQLEGKLSAFGASQAQLTWLRARGLDVDALPEPGPLHALSAEEPWLHLRPSPELLRALASRHPEEALWLRAGYPYQSGRGVLATGTTVEPFTIGMEDANAA